MSKFEAGRYTMVCTAAELTESKNKGTPQISITLALVDEHGESTGQEAYHNLSLHPNSAEYSLRDIRTLGWHGEDLERGDFMNEGVGSTFATVLFAEREWEGKTRVEVKSIFPEGGPMSGKPIEAAKKSGLNARLKGLIDSSKKAMAGAAPASPNGAAARTTGASKF